MSKRLIRFIAILVSLLFINIEAAQAGLVHRLRLYIKAEMSSEELFFSSLAFLLGTFVLYVIFTPLRINNQRLGWYTYFTFTTRETVRERRTLIKRINGLLRDQEVS